MLFLLIVRCQTNTQQSSFSAPLGHGFSDGMERPRYFICYFLHGVFCTSLKRLEIQLSNKKKSGKTVLIVNLQGSGGVRCHIADNKCNVITPNEINFLSSFKGEKPWQ